MSGRGHEWGLCMAWGGVRDRKMATAANGTHPTGMHSCILMTGYH